VRHFRRPVIIVSLKLTVIMTNTSGGVHAIDDVGTAAE